MSMKGVMGLVVLVILIFIFPASAEDEFDVDFHWSYTGPVHQELIIDINNLRNDIDILSMKSILKEANFDVGEIKNEKCEEWTSEEYNVFVCGICKYNVSNCTTDNKTNITSCVNESHTNANCDECGSRIEKRERWVWIERFLISGSTNKSELESIWENVPILEYGTKRFKLSFDVPIIQNDRGWGSSGTIYLNLNGETYVDKTNSSWWNSSWFYRTNVTIIGWNDTWNYYQMNVTLNDSTDTNTATMVFTNGHNNTNWTDIRVVQNGVEKPFWPENNNSTTKLWMNLTSNTTISVYYGNVGASDARDADATFIQYHGAADAPYKDANVIANNFAYEFRAKHDGVVSAHGQFGVSNSADWSNNDAVEFDLYYSAGVGTNGYTANNGALSSIGNDGVLWTAGVYYRMKSTYDGTTATYYKNGVLLGTLNTNVPDAIMGMQFADAHAADYSQEFSFIRNFSDPEPTWGTWRVEEWAGGCSLEIIYPSEGLYLMDPYPSLNITELGAITNYNYSFNGCVNGTTMDLEYYYPNCIQVGENNLTIYGYCGGWDASDIVNFSLLLPVICDTTSQEHIENIWGEIGMIWEILLLFGVIGMVEWVGVKKRGGVGATAYYICGVFIVLFTLNSESIAGEGASWLMVPMAVFGLFYLFRATIVLIGVEQDWRKVR